MYAPFASKDMVAMVVGRNLSRSAKGQALYPMIARNDQEQELLEEFRQEKIGELGQKYKNISGIVDSLRNKSNLPLDDKLAKLFGEAESALKILERQDEVLRRIEIRSNEAGQELSRLQPNHDKLYIIGHGGAGMNMLAADPECREGRVTGKDVARQLADGGLDKAFVDIRISACYSADSRRPMSFHRQDLERAAEPDTKRGGLLGVFGTRVVTREAFAQTLSNELNRVGFTQASVVGYHGAGVVYSNGDHQMQCLPDTKHEDIRSSTVRQHFAPSAAAQKIRTGNAGSGRGVRGILKMAARPFQQLGRLVSSAISRSMR